MLYPNVKENLQKIRVRKGNLLKVTDKKQLKNGNLYMENELNLIFIFN